MTYQELQRYRSIEQSIRDLRARRSDLRLIAAGLGGKPPSDVPSGKSRGDGTSRLTALMDKILELDVRIGERLVELEEAKLSVEEWCDDLPPSEAEVIKLRYVKGLSMKRVAYKLHRSVPRCYQLHDNAVSRLK